MRPLTIFQLCAVVLLAWLCGVKAWADDLGGSVAAYTGALIGVPVNTAPIREDIWSAATVRLKYTSCIEPYVTIHFHSARDYGEDVDANQILLNNYPPRIREWVRRHHALASQDWVNMSGREAIALGVPRCGTDS